MNKMKIISDEYSLPNMDFSIHLKSNGMEFSD